MHDGCFQDETEQKITADTEILQRLIHIDHIALILFVVDPSTRYAVLYYSRSVLIKTAGMHFTGW